VGRRAGPGEDCVERAGIVAGQEAGGRAPCAVPRGLAVVAVLLLATGIGVQTSVWTLMPVWYHLALLGLLQPITSGQPRTFANRLVSVRGTSDHSWSRGVSNVDDIVASLTAASSSISVRHVAQSSRCTRTRCSSPWTSASSRHPDSNASSNVRPHVSGMTPSFVEPRAQLAPGSVTSRYRSGSLTPLRCRCMTGRESRAAR